MEDDACKLVQLPDTLLAQLFGCILRANPFSAGRLRFSSKHIDYVIRTQAVLIAKHAWTIDLSTAFPSGDSAIVGEFMNIWRSFAYRMCATMIEQSQQESRDLKRDGLFPVIQASRRQSNRPVDYEEGCPDNLYSAIMNWEISAPYSIDNLGLVYQPSLPIAPFPYKASLTYYFEYSIHVDRVQYGGLPIIGYALPGLRRNIGGGAPHSICLSLTSPPYFYRSPSCPEPLSNVEIFSPGDIVGFGITKVPSAFVEAEFPMELSYDDREPRFTYSVFITLNGKLIHTDCSNIYPYELQPFVNYHCGAGVDSVNISGSPSHPWCYDLRRHIDTHPILPCSAITELPLSTVGPSPDGPSHHHRNIMDDDLTVSYYFEETDNSTSIGAPLSSEEELEQAILLSLNPEPAQSHLLKIEDVTDDMETKKKEDQAVEAEAKETSPNAGDGSTTNTDSSSIQPASGAKEGENEKESSKATTTAEDNPKSQEKPKYTWMCAKQPLALVRYHVLASHIESMRVEQMYLYGSTFSTRAYCYLPLELDQSLAPGYMQWEGAAKLSIEAVQDFANQIGAFPLPKNTIYELLSRYGWMETVPPTTEWPRSKSEIANMIRTSTVMAYLFLVAKEIAFRLSSPEFTKETFVPMELYMSARMLLLLIPPQYSEPLRLMPPVTHLSFPELDERYDAWRRRRAMGIPIPWTITEVRPFWMSLLRPVTIMRGLPKWKYSLTTADMPNYALQLLGKLGPQHLKLRTFIFVGLVHLPFSIVPSRDNLDVAPTLVDTLQGMYQARRLVRSQYQHLKTDLESFCVELASALKEQGDAGSSRKKKDKKKGVSSVPEIDLTAQEIASAMLWLFGDVPEINNVLGISLPPVPFSSKIASALSNLIWSTPDPLLQI